MLGDPGPLGLSKLTRNQPTPAVIEGLADIVDIAVGEAFRQAEPAQGSVRSHAKVSRITRSASGPKSPCAAFGNVSKRTGTPRV